MLHAISHWFTAGGIIGHRYSATFRGLSLKISENALATLKKLDFVEYIGMLSVAAFTPFIDRSLTFPVQSEIVQSMSCDLDFESLHLSQSLFTSAPTPRNMQFYILYETHV
jgi:hypothetical protein